MYSLKINIIGCDDRILPPAAQEILHRWAIIDVDYPSVASALKNVLITESETRLFVVQIASSDDVQELKRLSGGAPDCPIIAVVNAADSSLVVKCMRAGALQVIHSPVEPDDLREALNCISAQHGRLSTLAKLVAVTGAVGGCGGTTVAINLTDALARLQKTPCILMELALRKGVLANHLDIYPRYTTADLVAEMHRIDSFILRGALTEVAENFSVLAGPYAAIKPGVCGDADTVMKLVTLTRQLASWMVLDVPCAYDDIFFRSLMAADQIVLVVEQTVAAIRGAQMVCEGIGQRHPIVVINRYNPVIQGLTIDRIQGFLPTCRVCTVDYDAAVIDSMNSGRLLRAHSSRSPILADLDNLASQIAPPESEFTGEKQNGLLDRLARAFSLS